MRPISRRSGASASWPTSAWTDGRLTGLMLLIGAELLRLGVTIASESGTSETVHFE